VRNQSFQCPLSLFNVLAVRIEFVTKPKCVIRTQELIGR
jgi:hypothetical protein